MLQSKLADFDTIITQSGTTSNLKPEAVFETGSFTASNGATIPYRYYLPEDYETSGKTYPVFLYMHGNGSRGSDNATQLTTNGAALNTAVLNSKYDCIMIAPQCPSASQWVTNYPGGTGFAGELAAGARQNSQYLDAAIELLNYFITTYRADTSRIYVTGSSNGGGAAWSMTAWYPEVFAAAVPLAGTGDTGAAAAIASVTRKCRSGRSTETQTRRFRSKAQENLSRRFRRRAVKKSSIPKSPAAHTISGKKPQRQKA